MNKTAKKNAIECTFTTPGKTEVKSGLESVLLQGLSGEVEILPGHAELFALVKKGNVVLTYAGGKTEAIPVPESMTRVRNDKIVIIS